MRTLLRSRINLVLLLYSHHTMSEILSLRLC